MLQTVIFLLLARAVAGAAVWPQPQHQTPSERVLYLQPQQFDIRITGRGSDVLEHAIQRYTCSLADTPVYTPSNPQLLQRLDLLAGRIRNLSVYVEYSDQSLNLAVDESYTLQVDAPESRLTAATVWGALRGLETFSQLVDRIDLPHDILPDSLAGAAAGAEGPSSSAKAWLELSVSASAAAGQQLPGSDQLQKKKKHHSSKKHKRNKKHRQKKHKHHHKHHPGDHSFWIINATFIRDAPRFPHRGLLIDTARHFLPVPIIKVHLEAMELSKLNVLHWHISDDQSFPFHSTALPALSREGAFAPAATYSRAHVEDIVLFARERGIRVVPEFDTPGHTLSWGRGYPELLAPCYDKNGQPTGRPGPLDPTRKRTFTALWKLVRELSARFPDSYLHLGGDEVPLDCWKNNPDIQAWMRSHNMTEVRQLEAYYMKRLIRLANNANRSYIVWQEVVDNGVKVSNDTIIQVWKWWPVDGSSAGHQLHAPGMAAAGEGVTAASSSSSSSSSNSSSSSSSHGRSESSSGPGGSNSSHSHSGSSSGHSSRNANSGVSCRLSRGCSLTGQQVAVPAASFLTEFQRVTKSGYRALLSAPWYVSLGKEGEENWPAYHAVEPLDFEGSDGQKGLVVGGEACVWGEFVDTSNAVAKAWPDAAAVAERLWSPPAAGQPLQEVSLARERLLVHRCRMLARGVNAGPIGPGFCPTEAAVEPASARHARSASVQQQRNDIDSLLPWATVSEA